MQADMAAKANAATAVDDSKFAISVWGGYSFHMKSNYTKNVESMLEDVTALTNKSVDSKLGGIAGAAEFYYGSNFQIGGSVGYLKGHDITRKLTQGTTNYELTAKMDYTPVMVSTRYFFMPGLYAGLAAGLAPVTGATEKLADSTGAVINGGTPSVPWNLAYSGNAIIVQGRLGYDYAISNNLSIGVAGVVSYLSLELETFKQTTAGSTNTTLEKVSNNTILVTPALVVTFKF